jgi:hypothetical protein
MPVLREMSFAWYVPGLAAVVTTTECNNPFCASCLLNTYDGEVSAGRKLPELRNSKVVTLSELIDDVLEFVAHHRTIGATHAKARSSGKRLA